MAGDAMKRVQRGDRFNVSAETFNTLLDTARAHRDERQNLGVATRPTPRDGNVVLVENTDTNSRDWSIFSPVVVTPPSLGTTAPTLDVARNLHFRGNWPTGDVYYPSNPDYPFQEGDILGITQEPIPYGRIGRVQLAGLSCALALDPSQDGTPLTGQTYLRAKWDETNSRLVFERDLWGHVRCVQMIGEEKYTGSVYDDCYLFLVDVDPGSQQLWARLDEDLSGARSPYSTYGVAEATVWKRKVSSGYVYYWEETTTKVTVYAPPFLGQDEAIKAGNWVLAKYLPAEWRWYVLATTGEVLVEEMP